MQPTLTADTTRDVVVPSAPAARGVRQPWIMDGVKDFVLFAGAPVWILPAVMIAERFFAASHIYMFVVSFAFLGHHLPGMMRAYGDRALFQRFKARFIVGPIVLVGTSIAFAIVDTQLYALTCIAYSWGLWHGLMQVHGFLRIYDAKYGSFARTTARLDMWMCIAWFGVGVFFSPSRLHFLLEAFYFAGGPVIPEGGVLGLRFVWGVATALITLAFVANYVHGLRNGQPAHPMKLVTLVTSLGFWAYVCLYVDNLLVGIVMFDIFHAVQYLAIVWAFNRKRALTDPEGTGAFTQQLFGRSSARAVLYMGLVVAYGCLYFAEMLVHRYTPVSLTDTTPVYGAILAASGLLHFYYDSFIWKVKEKPTRELLGVGGGREVVRADGRWWNRSWSMVPAWAEHTLNWWPFVAAVCFFLYLQEHKVMQENEARLALGEQFESYDLAQSNLAIALYLEGDLDGAVAANRRALTLQPVDQMLLHTTRHNLSWALAERAERQVGAAQIEAARPDLQEAYRLNPDLPDALNAQGADLARSGRLDEAAVKYRTALVANPERPRVRTNLAKALAQMGELPEALEQSRRALSDLPDDRELQRLVHRLEEATVGAAGSHP